jgi:hypothetical protein
MELDEYSVGPDAPDFAALPLAKVTRAARLLALCSEPGTSKTDDARLADPLSPLALN